MSFSFSVFMCAAVAKLCDKEVHKDTIVKHFSDVSISSLTSEDLVIRGDKAKLEVKKRFLMRDVFFPL